MSCSYISHILIVVSITATTAIEFSPTLFTIWLCINMCFSKIVFHILIESTFINVTHFVFINSYKLMTREYITVRSNCYVVISATTASESFYSTWSLVKVNHKMKEIKLFSSLFIFNNFLCKSFVLIENSR